MDIKLSHLRAVEWLESARNIDNSWGYLPGQAGEGEPTLLACAAGLRVPLDWLTLTELHWSSLLLPATLSVKKLTPVLIEKFKRAMVVQRGRRLEMDPAVNRLDGSLRGWAWVEGTFSLVEPTAYALISSRILGDLKSKRVLEGRAMLLDRQCADGGWNTGNKEVLGMTLGSDVRSTAWAVMALERNLFTDQTMTRLQTVYRYPSANSLALTILARQCHSYRVEQGIEQLIQWQRVDGSFSGRCDWTAVAACALNAAQNGGHHFANPA